MKNEYEIRGDVTVIFLRHRDGTVVESLIDTADLPMVSALRGLWYLKTNRANHHGNAYVTMALRNGADQETYRLHRLITDAPPRQLVDHINHNTLDNRRSNLRITTVAVNNLNRSKPSVNSKSGHLGVYWHRRDRRWIARVNYKGAVVFEKAFCNLHDAIDAHTSAHAEILSQAITESEVA